MDKRNADYRNSNLRHADFGKNSDSELIWAVLFSSFCGKTLLKAPLVTASLNCHKPSPPQASLQDCSVRFAENTPKAVRDRSCLLRFAGIAFGGDMESISCREFIGGQRRYSWLLMRRLFHVLCFLLAPCVMQAVEPVLWLDAGKTETLVLGEEQVTEWRDASGKGISLVQPKVDHRPEPRAKLNGRR